MPNQTLHRLRDRALQCQRFAQWWPDQTPIHVGRLRITGARPPWRWRTAMGRPCISWCGVARREFENDRLSPALPWGDFLVEGRI